jgi:hypothetical protein
MTRKLTSENPMNSNDNEYDDLTALANIGEARQKDIRAWFGAPTYQDYAALSASEVKARFKDEGKLFTLKDIEESIADARERAQLPAQRNQWVATSNVTANTPTGEKGWEYIAAFVVEFKARKVEGIEKEREINARPLEITKDGTWGDVTGEKPTVVEGEELYQWMLGQVREEVPAEPEKAPRIEPEEEAPAEEKPAEAPPVRLKITEVRAFQPPEIEIPAATGKAGKPFNGFLREGEPFKIQVSFDLLGPGADDLTKKQIPYGAQFLTRKLPIGGRAVLGDTEPDTLSEGQRSYTAELAEVSLAPGIYHLRALARLQSTPPIGDFLEVPLLQVV